MGSPLWMTDRGSLAQLFASKKVSSLLLLGLFIVVAYIFVNVPPPGVSVAVLAFAAGLASVRDNSWRERLSWAVIFGLLLLVERKAIYVDRAESETEQTLRFEAQQNALQTVLHQGSDNFRATAGSLQTQLETTEAALKTTQVVLEEARRASTGVQESILDITGGNSYAYVYPSPYRDNARKVPLYSLNVHNTGDHPLMGVHLMVYKVMAGVMLDRHDEDIGFLAPHEGRSLQLELQPSSPGSYQVYVQSQARAVQERLDFRLSKEKNSGQPLEYRFVVNRLLRNTPRSQIRPSYFYGKEVLTDSGWVTDYKDPDIKDPVPLNGSAIEDSKHRSSSVSNTLQ